MKRKLVISMIALLSMVAMGCSQKQASIENDITTEMIAEVISTEEVVETEEASELAQAELEEALKEVEIPYYETYDDFVEAIGLSEIEYNTEGMYLGYEMLIKDLNYSPEDAFVFIAKDTSSYKIKEQAVAKDDKKPSNSSKPSSGSSSSGGVSPSGLPYWEEPVRTPEEAEAARDELNISRGGMSSEELKNCEVPEYTEEEKKILETIRGY